MAAVSFVEQGFGLGRETDDVKMVVLVSNSRRRTTALSSPVPTSWPAIEPDVSSTKTTSFGTILFSFWSIPGDARQPESSRHPNWSVGHQVHPNFVGLRSEKDLKVRVGLHVPGFVTQRGLIRSVTFDLHVWRGRINGFERALRLGANKATLGYEARKREARHDFQIFSLRRPTKLGVNLMTYRTSSDDGYFLLLGVHRDRPKREKNRSKDVVFVPTRPADGRQEVEQAKKALLFCVENLNEDAHFDIIRFSTETEPLFDNSRPASKENRSRRERFHQGTETHRRHGD